MKLRSVECEKVDYTIVLRRSKRKSLVYGYCELYHIPIDIRRIIIYYVHDNPYQYRNKILPKDFSGKDLSGFDFTGCRFIDTNLSFTNLSNVTLANTICDYQKAFQKNILQSSLEGGYWYQNNLARDLKSIAQVYWKLPNRNIHKAQLLLIACGLSRLPFYQNNEFYIKVDYWCCTLLQVRTALRSSFFKCANQLTCSLEKWLNCDARSYCWETQYPQNRITIGKGILHADFHIYFQNFINGLKEYQCSSKEEWGFYWYKEHITKNILGLQKAYPKIKDEELQEEACMIGDALSKSYQVKRRAFLYHYLLYQNRLVRLKELVTIEAKGDIHYSLKNENACCKGWDIIE